MSKLIKEVANRLLPFLVSLLLRQDELYLLELYTMHNYMIIRSHGRKQWWIEELVSIEIGFVRPNGDVYIQGKLDKTTLTPHDIAHLVCGVGYTMAEESLTGHYENLGKFKLAVLWSRTAQRAFHVRAFGRDLIEFGQLINTINKDGGDYRLDLFGKDLIITKI